MFQVHLGGGCMRRWTFRNAFKLQFSVYNAVIDFKSMIAIAVNNTFLDSIYLKLMLMEIVGVQCKREKDMYSINLQLTAINMRADERHLNCMYLKN